MSFNSSLTLEVKSKVVLGFAITLQRELITVKALVNESLKPKNFILNVTASKLKSYKLK